MAVFTDTTDVNKLLTSFENINNLDVFRKHIRELNLYKSDMLKSVSYTKHEENLH